MSSLEIFLTEDKREFKPGENITGKTSWSFTEDPEELHIRLFWYTEGKGSQDVCIVSDETFTKPGQSGERPFSIQTPIGPYSFSGKLISLIWAIEVIAEPDLGTERLEISISPNGKEIAL
ncbi:MAG: hypothetical protein IT291_01320 [Deltaproteobacteria bacterium]|nr:hypothetical protein [Deltaproteobacteria bacterium]